VKLFKGAKAFEWVVIWYPTEKEHEKESKSPLLVKGPEIVVAATEKEAFMTAAREIPEEYANNLNQIEVAVRPF
jgi:hypothetical protein